MYQKKKRAEEQFENRQFVEMAWMFAMPHSSSSATKSKKKRSSLPLQSLQAKRLQLGLPTVLNKNQSFPHVLCVIRYPSRAAPPAVKMQQQENQQLEREVRVRTAAVMKSRNSEEHAEEVAAANINKQRDAGRAN